jgi:hypothetical protein
MSRRRAGRLRRVAWTALILVGVYLLVAYVALPRMWTHYEHEPGLAGRPMLTYTADGIPGDPLNVGLVGTKEEAIRALAAAGWYPADAITFRSSVEIAGSVLFDRPYRDAPVSPLFYDGKSQAFAFEKPLGTSADRRNHVRFFATLEKGAAGRPVWLGSATFDRGVGVSHYTGEITHHIGPDIDAERTLLMDDLTAAHMLTEIYDVTGVGPTLFGKNGGGDPYYTDGELRIGVLSAGAELQTAPPKILPDSPAVELKNRLFSKVKPYLADEAPPEVENTDISN